MTINITKEIQAAYDAYLAEQIDSYFDGRPILRSDTYPYNESRAAGMVDFAAGYQVGAAPSDRAAVDDPVAAVVEIERLIDDWMSRYGSTMLQSGETLQREDIKSRIRALTTQAPADQCSYLVDCLREGCNQNRDGSPCDRAMPDSEHGWVAKAPAEPASTKPRGRGERGRYEIPRLARGTCWMTTDSHQLRSGRTRQSADSHSLRTRHRSRLVIIKLSADSHVCPISTWCG